MNTATRRSAMSAVLALGLFTLGATAAQAGENFYFQRWLRSHPVEVARQAPAEANVIPSVVYPFPARASAGHVEESLLRLGFTAVRSVSRSGNVYSAEAMWDGQWVDLRIDARNGRISARPN